MGFVDLTWEDSFVEETFDKIGDILANNVPSFMVKNVTKSIWSQRFVYPLWENNILDFILLDLPWKVRIVLRCDERRDELSDTVFLFTFGSFEKILKVIFASMLDLFIAFNPCAMVVFNSVNGVDLSSLNSWCMKIFRISTPPPHLSQLIFALAP